MSFDLLSFARAHRYRLRNLQDGQACPPARCDHPGTPAYQGENAWWAIVGNRGYVAMDGQKDDPPSGYAVLNGRDAIKADFAGTIDRACRKAVLARNPVEVEPGEYDVVLEASAICQNQPN